MRDFGSNRLATVMQVLILTGSFALRLDSTGSIAQFLVGIQLQDLGIDYPQKRNSYIEAVSLDDVRRVAKRLDAPYQAGARNYNWIKLKRSYQGELRDTVDCVVVGYWQGKGHRARLGIGTLLTAVYDKDRDVFTTVTRLGSGFKEDDWRRLKELLDAVAEDQRPARVESLLEPDWLPVAGAWALKCPCRRRRRL